MDTKKSDAFSLRHIYRILFLTGIGITTLIVYVSMPIQISAVNPIIYVKLFGIACLGLFLRSLRRKIFFRSKLSLHQSMSFEIIIECLQFLSPLLPQKTFEAEFIERETTIKTDSVGAWLQARIMSTYTIALLSASFVALLYKNKLLSYIFLGLAIFVILFAFLRKRHGGINYIMMTLSGIAVWGIEGYFFVTVLSIYLPVADSCVLYLLFTAIIEFSPIPFAIGLAEMPVLLFSSPIALWILLIFHVSKIIPITVLSFAYIPRYKFKFSDFFNPKILEVLHLYPDLNTPEKKIDMEKGPFISIVIPAYNEAERLPGFMKDVVKYMNEKAKDFDMEVLVVDDGSTDNTVELVEEMIKKDKRIKLLKQIPNQGKGAAVRRGMLEATGKYAIYADADGATPITELENFLPLIAKNEKIIIGSRKMTSQEVERERKGIRALMGIVFYKMVNFFAVPGIKDTQCGFKMYRKDIIHKIFPRSLENGWAFDVELLYLAQLMGHPINEVGVNWHEVEGSKINPIKDAIKMLIAIFRIRSSQGGFLNDS
ncbi:MAG: dolichyl-phosphate beta-glucosyltransferase [Verrucomicrobiota bacterium]|nr:dolichyl-phosphate beta-glucosyltransferase [Verrucomicrobiota bacterium]